MRYLKAWRPTPSFVVSCISLFVALSGTAIALQGKNGVKSDDIAPGAVHRGDIANKAINGAKVAADSLTGANIDESTLAIGGGGGGGGGTPSGPAGGDLAGTYPNPTIAAGAIGPSQLQTGAIPADGTGIDGSTKVAPNSIGFQEVDDNAVHRPNIFDGAVGGDKLANIRALEDSVNLNPGQSGQVQAVCPADDRLISGGFLTGGTIDIAASFAGSNSWVVRGANRGNAVATLIGRAYCLE